MAFRVSPGVSVTEKDFTNVIPAVSTTKAGYAGPFNWGPIDKRVLVASENELVSLFNEPDDSNYAGWLCAANFLGYGGSLTVARATVSGALNSGAARTIGDNLNSAGAQAGTGGLIENSDVHSSGQATNTGYYGVGGTGAGVKFFAKYAGSLGNSLRIAVAQRGPTGATNGVGVGVNGVGFTLAVAATSGTTQVQVGTGSALPVAGATSAIIGDLIRFNSLKTKNYTITGMTANVSGKGWLFDFTPALGSTQAAGISGQWESPYKSYIERARTSTNVDFYGGTGDQFSILVIDQNGKFSGVTGTILETFNHVSKAIDGRDGDGNSNYYVTVVNNKSKYIWVGGATIDNIGAGSAPGITFGDTAVTFSNATRQYLDCTGGSYGTPSDANKLSGYNLFGDPDTVDISLLLGADASASLAGDIIDIADARKDCVAFVSPESGDVVDVISRSEQIDNVVDYRDNQLNKVSSYAFLDSGWKYMYDRYSDKLRWVPLNGDMAGLCARTDNVNDPWFSPAGFNRGQIRGVVKLALNPTEEAYRDELYTNEINPVVSFPGEGTVLFGDKTLQSKGSAFDRINVRRLFIVMEKAISTAAKFQLFEQNDSFTRAQFKNMIEPFLRDIQGRRGITDFKVVCDDTNNTSSVIDSNKFVADIFVKPTRSINFIQLNFAATRSGVDFSEIAGG
jgi:hypothetical protein